MDEYTHRQFFASFLRALGFEVRRPPLRALAAVSIYESSQGDNRWFNPLAVSGGAAFRPGATPYNTFGNNQHVWCYRAFGDGVDASAELYSGPHWSAVRNALDSAPHRDVILDAFRDAYTWVTPRFEFRDAAFNQPAILDARLAHRLR